MKIRIFGFEWEIEKGISYEEFCLYLEQWSGVITKDRIIALSKMDGLWAGVLLTIKDEKAFCKMRRARGGRFTISPEELEEGTNMVAFNFFILNSATGRGLYQHYNHSASTNTFCGFCSERFRGLKKARIEEAARKAGLDPESRSIRVRQIKNRFSDKLRYSVLIRQEAFDELVRDLSSIKSFDFEFATLGEKEKDFLPLGEHAKRVSHRMVFSNNPSPHQIKNGIIGLNRIGLKRGKVKGIDPNGNEAVYKVMNNHQSFAEFDYDEVIRTVEIDSDNLVDSIQKSYIIGALIDLAKRPRVKALISTPAK